VDVVGEREHGKHDAERYASGFKPYSRFAKLNAG